MIIITAVPRGEVAAAGPCRRRRHHSWRDETIVLGRLFRIYIYLYGTAKHKAMNDRDLFRMGFSLLLVLVVVCVFLLCMLPNIFH